MLAATRPLGPAPMTTASALVLTQDTLPDRSTVTPARSRIICHRFLDIKELIPPRGVKSGMPLFLEKVEPLTAAANPSATPSSTSQTSRTRTRCRAAAAVAAAGLLAASALAAAAPSSAEVVPDP